MTCRECAWRSGKILSAAVIALGLGSGGGHAQAQSEPPARNANIWGGRAHEPNPGAVQAEERKEGIAPDAARQRALDSEVEHLDRKLLEHANPQ